MSMTMQRAAMHRAVRQAADRRMRQQLDDAVVRCSAFKNLNDLLDSIEQRGYVPTLRFYGEPEFDQAVRLVRRELIKRGCKVSPEKVEA